ncbi:hypothetical protein, partial [Streptomyces formicae]
RGTTLSTTYDVLGRKTAMKKGKTVLSSWTWDMMMPTTSPEVSRIRRSFRLDVYRPPPVEGR